MAKVALMSFREFMSLAPADQTALAKGRKTQRQVRTARQTVHNTRCERVLGAARDRITVVRPGPQQPPMDERLVALFDWVADQLEIATPGNVIGVLGWIPWQSIPEQHLAAYDLWLKRRHDGAIVRRWFDEIEPGQVEMEEW